MTLSLRCNGQTSQNMIFTYRAHLRTPTELVSESSPATAPASRTTPSLLSARLGRLVRVGMRRQPGAEVVLGVRPPLPALPRPRRALGEHPQPRPRRRRARLHFRRCAAPCQRLARRRTSSERARNGAAGAQDAPVIPSDVQGVSPAVGEGTPSWRAARAGPGPGLPAGLTGEEARLSGRGGRRRWGWAGWWRRR